MKHVVNLAIAFCLLAQATNSMGALPRWTMQVRVGGQLVEGMPLGVTDDRLWLLGRDGRLIDFNAAEARDYKQTATSFRPNSLLEMRSQLERDLGTQLEIVSTNHYVVAHPRTGRADWADRFETLYRSFVHFFRVRGLKVRDPEFPLVAVVLPSQRDFLRFAAADGQRVGPGVLGYYSPISNRILLYDIGGRNGSAADWGETAATIIHEATHQTAFNTGVHDRFAQPPRWLAEGLGMMYEARGVYDSTTYTTLKDRINAGRLTQFRSYQSGNRPPHAFAELVSADDTFFKNPDMAYAESWAFSFFLMETQPRRYGEYLQKTSLRPGGEPYTRARRMADFVAIFGQSIPMLEADFLRFIATLPSSR